MLSQSSPSLNRFPGLTLRAWVLYSGGAVRSGFNVSGVDPSSGTLRITLQVPLGSAHFVCDVGAPTAAAAIYSSATGERVDIIFKDGAGVQQSIPTAVYVAVYQ